MQLVFTRYGVERLLYRLSHTPGGERFVLKGAVLLEIADGVQRHRVCEKAQAVGFDVRLAHC